MTAFELLSVFYNGEIIPSNVEIIGLKMTNNYGDCDCACGCGGGGNCQP